MGMEWNVPIYVEHVQVVMSKQNWQAYNWKAGKTSNSLLFCL